MLIFSFVLLLRELLFSQLILILYHKYLLMSNRYRKDGSVLHIGEKKSGRGVIGEEREKMAANREHLVGVSNTW